MGVFVASRLDRTKLVCPIPKVNVAGVEKGFFQLCGKYCVGADTTAGGKIQSYKASFLPNHGSDAMRLELFKCYGKTYLRYDFNPNNIAAADLQGFIKATQCLGYGSYSHVLQAGTIHYLEIAIDYIGQHTTRYIFHKAHVHTSDVFTDGKQAGGSYYLGSRDSDSYIIAYDKAEERYAAGLPYPFKQALRIEARLQGQSIKVSALGSVPNPFLRLVVADIARMRNSNAVDPAIRNYFIQRARQHGVPIAVKGNFSAKQRKTLIELMGDCTPLWWKSTDVLHGFATRAHRQLQVDFAANL